MSEELAISQVDPNPTDFGITGATVIVNERTGQLFTRNLANQVKQIGPDSNFTPSGTGATTRTVQSKLREYVSITDFGADGTAANDTTAFTNALATGKDVFVPEGTWLLSSAQTISTQGQSIFGVSFLKSIIQRSSDSTFVMFNVTSTSGNTFRDLRFTEASGYPTYTNTGSYVQLPVSGGTDINFLRCWFHFGWQHVRCMQGTSNINFNGCIFEAARKGAIYSISSIRNNVLGCTFWKNSTDTSNTADRGYAITLTKDGAYNFGSDNWNVVGNYFAENVYGPFLLLNTVEGTQITGNFFEIASQTDNGVKSDIDLTSCTGVSIVSNASNSRNNSYVAGQRGSKYCVDMSGGGNSQIAIIGNNFQAGVTGTINGTPSGVSPIIGNAYSDSTSDTYSGPVQFAQTLGVTGISTLSDRLNALGGTAANVSSSAIRLNNDRIVTWLDSGGGLTNPGFVWYDSSHNLNLGTTNNTRLQITSAGALRSLGTSNGPVGTVTLAANAASTAVSNTAVTASSLVFLFPTSANAAADVGSATGVYISAKSAGVSFTITHPNNANADKTFNYVVLN